MFKPPRPVGMGLNLAPMVDVMMCLIIFFLLASKIIDAENKPVDLAFAVAAQEVDTSELGARVTINVRPARARGSEPPDPNKADYVVIAFDGTDVTERVLMSDELTRYLQTRADAARARGEELRCVIRADKAVMYQHVEAVLRGAGLAKIAKIVFSTKKGVDPEGAA